MQTDDTLILGDDAFVEREGVELEKAKLIAKPVKSLTRGNPLLFNRYKLEDTSSGITIVQKEQGKRLSLVDFKSDQYKQAYLEQRARGAYIGSIY